jgi:hypothetical protein
MKWTHHAWFAKPFAKGKVRQRPIFVAFLSIVLYQGGQCQEKKLFTLHIPGPNSIKTHSRSVVYGGQVGKSGCRLKAVFQTPFAFLIMRSDLKYLFAWEK